MQLFTINGNYFGRTYGHFISQMRLYVITNHIGIIIYSP